MEPQAKPSDTARFGRDLFMVALALFSIALLIYDEITDPIGSTREALILIDWFVVTIFAAEFGLRLWRSESKQAFLKRNWFELPGLVPMAVGEASFLRVFRLARLARLFRLFRLVAVLARLRRANRVAERFIVQSHVLTLVSVAATVILAGAYGFWFFERNANDQLHTFFDAVWFAIVTATTVGYGDIFPVTTGGRVVGAILMFTGIGLVGTIAATFANALARHREAEKEEASQAETGGVDERLGRLDALHADGTLTDEEYARVRARILGEAS